MNHYEKRTVTEEMSVLVKVTCDCCGTETGSSRWPHLGLHEVNEVTIRHKLEHSYPDGGDGGEFSPDVCPACFTEKVLPALRAIGINVPYREWSW